MSNDHDSLVELLKCPSCSFALNSKSGVPYSLKCGHIQCARCIIRFVRRKKSTSLKCSVCREVSQLNLAEAGDGEIGLPKSFFICNLIDAAEKKELKETGVAIKDECPLDEPPAFPSNTTYALHLNRLPFYKPTNSGARVESVQSGDEEPMNAQQGLGWAFNVPPPYMPYESYFLPGSQALDGVFNNPYSNDPYFLPMTNEVPPVQTTAPVAEAAPSTADGPHPYEFEQILNAIHPNVRDRVQEQLSLNYLQSLTQWD